MTTDNSNARAVRLEEKDNGIVHLVLDAPGQSANTMDAAYREAMDIAVAELKQKKENNTISGIVIRSEKKTFFAGGDLNELVQVTPAHAEEFYHGANAVKQNLRDIETLGVPVVAAINGTALGGGFEIALACHYRICLNDESIQLGLPEVQLGLLPGGGGVIRMVRYLGVETALQYLLEGKKIRPSKAKSVGLVHDIAETPEELIAKAEQWISENKNAKQPWDVKGFKLPGGAVINPKVAQRIAVAPSFTRKKTAGCYPAAEAIIAAAVEGAQIDFDYAQQVETRYFTELATGKVSKNMINAFWFQLNSINAGSSRPDNLPKYTTKKVGVIGAGMMGAGIAYVTAKAGIEVVLKDVSQEAADKGKDYSAKLLEKKVKRGFMSEAERDEFLALINATANADDFDGCDLIIEAVFEDKGLKAKVTQEATAKASAEAVIASNTSTLPITGLAEAIEDSERFIGLHFFSPVDKMPLLEIIKGKQTNDETLAKAFDYALQIKKTPIVVNDARGFYTTRVFSTYTQEAIAMVGEGIHPVMIENEAKSAGFPVSPLAVSDEVSLTLMQHIRDQTVADLQAEGADFKVPESFAVVDKMSDEFDRKGKAAGAGFYEYNTNKAGKTEKSIWPGLMEHFYQANQQIDPQDIRDRLLFIQSIEAIKAMEEGVIDSVADANIGSVFGIGFAPWAGGVLQFVNYYGAKEFVTRCNELAAKYGERFEPPALVQEKAQKGEEFVANIAD